MSNQARIANIASSDRPLIVDLRSVEATTHVQMKKCTNCGNVKDIDDFGSNSTSSDGRQSYCRKCRNNLHKERRTEDIGRRIRHHFCTRITYQLKLIGRPPPDHLFNDLEKYLGYKIWQLEANLHAQTKAEYGISLKTALTVRGFHIDHRRPLSSFPVKSILDASFQECWAISNLKAIPAAENLAKGSKYDEATNEDTGEEAV
jgi:hypothetical protein